MVSERILGRVPVQRHDRIELGVALLELEVILDHAANREWVRTLASCGRERGSGLMERHSLAESDNAASSHFARGSPACARMGAVPRLLPTSPLALAFLGYRVWRRLPAAQRRRVLAAAVVYAPQLWARARCGGALHSAR